jgi:hypothetical protein
MRITHVERAGALRGDIEQPRQARLRLVGRERTMSDCS